MSRTSPTPDPGMLQQATEANGAFDLSSRRGVLGRFQRLVVILTLLLGVSATSPLPVAAVSWGSCVDSLMAHYHTWTEKSSDTNNIKNLKANLITRSLTDQFRPCSWNNAMNGVSGWVALVPGHNNPREGSTTAILQIGPIACAHQIQSACQSHAKRIFWAEGGCGLSVPDAQDLGSVDNAYHNYEIRHYLADLYSLFVDGVSKVAFSGQSHSDVSCWVNSNYTKGQWALERWDRGDGIGDITHRAIFGSPKLMWGDPGANGTYVNANFTGCIKVQPPSGGQSFCEFGSDYFNAWTVN